MKTAKTDVLSCRLMVIGAGMAGMAAALFAARHGVSTVQAGLTGETQYASGLFDLYGVKHGSTRALIDDPWQGLKQLKQDHPKHPFCRVSTRQIRSAMDRLTDFLGEWISRGCVASVRLRSSAH
ncbi:MAG: FAD-binding protein [Desulfosarcina sp.]|nr:FAD-binding protein [Desulfosarcina sp.]MBC2766501.1 FAD-binding protein [Desulfosarcina sp.]